MFFFIFWAIRRITLRLPMYFLLVLSLVVYGVVGWILMWDTPFLIKWSINFLFYSLTLRFFSNFTVSFLSPSKISALFSFIWFFMISSTHLFFYYIIDFFNAKSIHLDLSLDEKTRIHIFFELTVAFSFWF